MPKLPVFTAKGTITTETGSAQTNIQMGLDQNLASALDPNTNHTIIKITLIYSC